MRIILVSEEFPPDTARGGIGSQNWNKARAFAALGHDVEVLSALPAPGPARSTRTPEGILVHRIPTPGDEPDAPYLVYNDAAYWTAYSSLVCKALSRLLEEPADVVDFAEYGGEAAVFLMNQTV